MAVMQAGGLAGVIERERGRGRVQAPIWERGRENETPLFI